jgi:hypothetical protein
MNAPDFILKTAAAKASYQYSFSEKIQLAMSCLMQRLSPRKNLVAGPFAGEFGYEVMQWQGYVRARRRYYESVHVLTYPGNEYFYEGCVVHHHDIPLEKAGYGYGLMSPAASYGMAQEKAKEWGLDDFDVLSPALMCTQYHKRILGGQEFRLFEEKPVDNQKYDLAFHFRSVRKEGPDQSKNYSHELADKLVQLCEAGGKSVICMGHPKYSYCPQGCKDYRSVDLKTSVAVISSVKIVVGENSGPMHLANLCGKPTVLWAADQWRIDYSLRWNPFHVPIIVAANDTHQPAPERVYGIIDDFLNQSKEMFESNKLRNLKAQPIAWY